MSQSQDGSENQILNEVVTKLGIVIEDGKTADEVVNIFIERQKGLLLNDSSFIEPIKEKIKTEAEIVSIKKSKKSIANQFGLTYSNNELADKTIDELLDEAKNKANTSTEVEEVRSAMMKIAKEKEEIEHKMESSIAEVHKSYAEKFASEKFNSSLINELSKGEYIVSAERLTDIISKSINVKPSLKDGALIFLDEKGNQALTENKTNFVDIAYIVNKYAIDFKKHSNGSGERKEVVKVDNFDKLPEAMRKRMQEMKLA